MGMGPTSRSLQRGRNVFVLSVPGSRQSRGCRAALSKLSRSDAFSFYLHRRTPLSFKNCWHRRGATWRDPRRARRSGSGRAFETGEVWNRLGFVCCHFLRCSLLAVGCPRYLSNRALRLSVADPYDRLAGIAFGAAPPADARFQISRRFQLAASAHGSARHRSVCSEQSRNANRADFDCHGSIVALRSRYRFACCYFSSRTHRSSAMDRHHRDFFWDRAHRPVSLGSAGTLTTAMSAPFCNVALPVPLRTTFTYAVPEALRRVLQLGCRVLVPFRKKSLVGVVVELVPSPPAGTKLRDITRVIDFVPALTPGLLELGQWIASYYLAPVGEVFRSMLPPPTEISSQREVGLTAAGRALAAEQASNFLLAGNAGEEAGALAALAKKGKAISLAAAVKLDITAELLQRLQQRGLLEIRETVRGRKQRTQRIIAWKGKDAPRAADAEKLERLRA